MTGFYFAGPCVAAGIRLWVSNTARLHKIQTSQQAAQADQVGGSSSIDGMAGIFFFGYGRNFYICGE